MPKKNKTPDVQKIAKFYFCLVEIRNALTRQEFLPAKARSLKSQIIRFQQQYPAFCLDEIDPGLTLELLDKLADFPSWMKFFFQAEGAFRAFQRKVASGEDARLEVHAMKEALEALEVLAPSIMITDVMPGITPAEMKSYQRHCRSSMRRGSAVLAAFIETAR